MEEGKRGREEEKNKGRMNEGKRGREDKRKNERESNNNVYEVEIIREREKKNVIYIE